MRPRLPLVEARLDNGLRVVVSEDHLLPVVAVNVWYAVGSRHEQPGRTGLAHLFEHLMFQGSTNVASGEHFALVQQAGGTLNGTTSFDRTNYFESLPVGALDLALWLESDRMGGLLDALTQDNLDNQRDVVKNERRQRYDNQPYGTAIERLLPLLLPAGHPYAHTPIGAMSDLDAVSLEDCAEFFRTYYAPGNAVLAIVGDVEANDVVRRVERYFGPVPAYTAAPPPPDGRLDGPVGSRREVLDESVPSPAVYLAWALPADGTDEIEAAEAALGVLGAGLSSRLERRLVREEQLAQDVTVQVLRLVGGVSVALLISHARSGVTVERVEAAVESEVAALAAGGPQPDEVDVVRALAERVWLSQVETCTGRADQLARFGTLFHDPSQVNHVLDRIAGVTPEQVRAAAALWFTPDNMAALAYPGAGG